MSQPQDSSRAARILTTSLSAAARIWRWGGGSPPPSHPCSELQGPVTEVGMEEGGSPGSQAALGPTPAVLPSSPSLGNPSCLQAQFSHLCKGAATPLRGVVRRG